MNFQCLFTLLFSFLILSSLMGQRIISGIVKDEFNDPLPGATVLIKDSDIGTITDLQGQYSIEVPMEAKTLVVSFLGYADSEVNIGSLDVVHKRMRIASSFLDEIVVTGLAIGTPRQRQVLA